MIFVLAINRGNLTGLLCNFKIYNLYNIVISFIIHNKLSVAYYPMAYLGLK